MRAHGVCALALLAALMGGNVYAEESDAGVSDPLEPFNRAVFTFNDYADQYVLKPIAKGYDTVMPDVADRGVSNFFSNLGDVLVLANNLLQFKFSDAMSDAGRVLMNTTLGIGGLLDVATPAGLTKHEEDFGQTLGYWGVSSGPYVVLPLLGPSTLRDAVARYPDGAAHPLQEVNDIAWRNSLRGLEVIDNRADLLKAEKLISGDKYLFLRDVYLQRREWLVKDGQVEDDFGNEDF